jgi:hypothetical protein
VDARRTANDVAGVVRAAYGGHIAVLFVARGRQQPGVFDPAQAVVEVYEEPRPGDEDLLNCAAVYTLLHAGTVYVTEPEKVPGGGALAAIYWLPLSRKAK